MPVRQYLDNTVVPLMLQAMTEVAKVRYAFHHLVLKILCNLLRSIYLTTRIRRREGHLKRMNDFMDYTHLSTSIQSLYLSFLLRQI